MPDWVGDLSPRTTVLATSSSMPLLLGRFRCRPGDPAWREVNYIGDAAYVVFPQTAVGIAPTTGPMIAADPNGTLLYAPGQEYRRKLLDPRGDDCLFVALGAEAVEELGLNVPEPTSERASRIRESACSATVYMSLQLLRAELADAVDDPLVVDEELLTIVEGVLGSAPQVVDPGEAGRLVESVRSFLAVRYRDPLRLADVSEAVAVSPYHLHRRFRAATGWTIHSYQEQLRLREGLVRILDGATDLAAVAYDLGYSSHSHFTARFRKAFGMAPSMARRAGRP